MRYGFVNNFEQTLAVELAAGATTMTLDGGGALLTNISSTFRYRLTLIEEDAEGVEIGYELVDVTAVSGDDLTIVRAREGTSDQLWPAGSRVALRITAAVANEFLQNDARIIWGGGTVAADPVPSGVIRLAYGGYITAEGPQVAIGDDVYNYGNKGISIGFDTNVQDDGGIGIGDNIAVALHGICLSAGDGEFAGTYEEKAIAMGYRVQAQAAFSQAYGAQAESWVEGGVLNYGIPYLKDFPPTPLANQPAASLLCASQVVFALDRLDLTVAAAVETLGLPSGCRLFIDSLEVVVVSASSPSGSPEIKIGTDDVNTDNLLGATTVTANTVYQRQIHAPLDDSGVTGVRAEVVTAGSGTWRVRVMIRGYVLEE